MSDVHAMLAGLCPANGTFALTASLAERRYQVSRLGWRADGEGAAITIEGAIDQAALELGPTVVLDRIELILDSRGRPTRYARTSGKEGLTITFGGGQAHALLKDGTTFQVDADPDAVLDGNAPALTALLLRRSFCDSGSIAQRRAAFLAGQLLPLSYAVTAGGDDRWRSSLDEVLTVDAHGRLIELVMEKQALSVLPATADDLELLDARPPARSAPRRAAEVDGEEFDVALPAGSVRALLWGAGNVPLRRIVLLLSGSGRIDRFGRAVGVDTGTGEIAAALAHAGYAAMTADQPGSGDSKLPADALSAGFGGEMAWAEALLDAALQRSNSRAPVALVGHSLGGLLALELAVRRPDDVAAVALLATPGRPLDQVIEDQIRWIGERRGVADYVVAEQVAEHRRLIELIRSVPVWNSETVPERFLAQVRTRDWLAGLIDIDPAALAARTRCPLFVAQGDRDVQVSVDADFFRLAGALRGVEAHLYPDLNHLFRAAGEDEGVAGYAQTDAPVADLLLRDLRVFLDRSIA